jgi:hypothetical protein
MATMTKRPRLHPGPTPHLTARTYWESIPRTGGERLVREWVDASGSVVRFQVVTERAANAPKGVR